MSRKYDFDHRIAGLTILLGVPAVALGAVLPWMEAKGPKTTVYIVEGQPQSSISGFDSGAHGVLATALVVAGLALVVAIALMATHHRRGLVLRLLALLCGVVASGIGAIFVVIPQQNHGALLSLFSSAGLAEVKPGLGAYLLAVGGLVVLMGAVIPGRRTLRAPIAAPA